MKTYSLKDFRDIAKVGMRVKVENKTRMYTGIVLTTDNNGFCIGVAGDNQCFTKSDEEKGYTVTLLSESEKTLENLSEGDEVWSGYGDKRIVLARCGPMVDLSCCEGSIDNWETTWGMRLHIEQLKRYGYTLTPPKNTCPKCGK